MSGYAGDLFIRIRPDASGFAAATEQQVAQQTRGVGTRGAPAAAAAGRNLGREVALGLVKGFVGLQVAETIVHQLREGFSSAAQVQTLGRSVSQQFGGEAAKGLKEFADTAVREFGITEEASLRLQTRIGILLNNLHIAPDRAAQMAVGLEQIAGAVAKIRGTDPEQIFQQLPLLLAGNLRSMKQLGFAFDQTQIKVEAFREGLIKTRDGAINPSIKAQAIYGLLVKQLPVLLAEASKHNDDLINKQRVLAAEWDKERAQLASALIPALGHVLDTMQSYVDGVQKMIDVTRKFGGVIRDVVDKIPGAQAADQKTGGFFSKTFDVLKTLGTNPPPVGEYRAWQMIIRDIRGDADNATQSVQSMTDAINAIRSRTVSINVVTSVSGPSINEILTGTVGVPGGNPPPVGGGGFVPPGSKPGNTQHTTVNDLTKMQRLQVEEAQAAARGDLQAELKAAQGILSIYNYAVRSQHLTASKMKDLMIAQANAQGQVTSIMGQIDSNKTTAQKNALDKHNQALQDQIDLLKAAISNPLEAQITALQGQLDRMQAADQTESIRDRIRKAAKDLADAQASIQIVGALTPAQKRDRAAYLQPFQTELRQARRAKTEADLQTRIDRLRTTEDKLLAPLNLTAKQGQTQTQLLTQIRDLLRGNVAEAAKAARGAKVKTSSSVPGRRAGREAVSLSNPYASFA